MNLKKARDTFMKCVRCGAEENLELHHIIPEGLGGSDDPGNLLHLCRRCHNWLHRKVHLTKYIRLVKGLRERDSPQKWYIVNVKRCLEILRTPPKNEEEENYHNFIKDLLKHSKPLYMAMEVDEENFDKLVKYRTVVFRIPGKKTADLRLVPNFIGRSELQAKSAS